MSKFSHRQTFRTARDFAPGEGTPQPRQEKSETENGFDWNLHLAGGGEKTRDVSLIIFTQSPETQKSLCFGQRGIMEHWLLFWYHHSKVLQIKYAFISSNLGSNVPQLRSNCCTYFRRSQTKSPMTLSVSTRYFAWPNWMPSYGHFGPVCESPNSIPVANRQSFGLAWVPMINGCSVEPTKTSQKVSKFLHFFFCIFMLVEGCRRDCYNLGFSC